ncbi:MAG: DUF3365 domain-containing protein [Acaryochloridaceae cyanobacterium RL_2_7]|nr:DUF3365 domain-containing protein [Acaryochloridaceae cyanobacterium RL_2_7]
MIRFNLWAKFSIFLFLVWVVVSGSTLLILSKHLNQQAESDISDRAEIVLNAMQSVRNYTQDHLQPLLQDHPTAFIQEAIPNFGARMVFKEFQRQDQSLANFLYKEATPNPTNPKDLADAFESEIVQKLQQAIQTSHALEVSGYRLMNDQKVFYSARPLVVTDESCLQCHGNSKDAPQYLVDMYGSQNVWLEVK